MAQLLDNFNRANEGPPPSSSWTNVINGLKVVSNACKGNGSGVQNISFWNAQMGPDVDVEVTLDSKGGTNQFVELYLGMTTQSSGTMDGYCVRMNPQSGTDQVIFFRIDNGTFAQIGSVIGQEITGGDKIRFRRVGDVISVWRHDGSDWAELGNRTDATYSAAGYVGIGIAHTIAILDDFCAETISGDVVVTPSPATVKGAAVNPTVVLGSLTLNPTAAAARSVAVNPAVVLGSIIITPSSAIARAVVAGPIVIGGGGINPLGEGDSPGFLAFLVASSIFQNLEAAGIDTGLDAPDESNSASWENYLFG